MDEVKDLLEPMLAGMSLERSEALRALARHVVSQKESREATAEEIEEWAARVAADSSHATD